MRVSDMADSREKDVLNFVIKKKAHYQLKIFTIPIRNELKNRKPFNQHFYHASFVSI